MTVDDLEKSQRTIVCKSCDIVAKRYVIGGGDGTIG